MVFFQTLTKHITWLGICITRKTYH